MNYLCTRKFNYYINNIFNFKENEKDIYFAKLFSFVLRVDDGTSGMGC